MLKEQRFIFDEVAELYARTRPGYPTELIDDVLGYAGGSERVSRILEIGCGAGQATTAFASRGRQVVALEPGPKLARSARERVNHLCDGRSASRVEIKTTTFEDYELPDEKFDLVICAQAFHWLTPGVRFSKTAAALRPNGVLAVFGNKPAHEKLPVYREIESAYAECAPSLAEEVPANDACTAGGHSIAREFAAASQFGELRQRSYAWRTEYSAADYVDLMQTQSNHRLLPASEREALLERIHAAIEDAGGSLPVPYVAHLIMARRAVRSPTTRDPHP